MNRFYAAVLARALQSLPSVTQQPWLHSIQGVTNSYESRSRHEDRKIDLASLTRNTWNRLAGWLGEVVMLKIAVNQ